MPWKKEIRELRENYCSNKNCTCNQFQELYTRTDFLGLCWGRFSLEPNFSTHSLQIYCIGLFGPRSFAFLGLGLKQHPYKWHFQDIIRQVFERIMLGIL